MYLYVIQQRRNKKNVTYQLKGTAVMQNVVEWQVS